MQEVILINISGEDKPGLTSSITGILAGYGVNILDIGQAVIHDTLSLGILAGVPRESETSPVIKDILYRAYELGVKMTFTPIPEVTYESWVKSQGKSRYLITLLSRKITAEHISRVTAIVAENRLNIDSISRLSGRISLDDARNGSKACVQFSVRGEPENLNSMRAEFIKITEELGLDIAFQKDDVFRRSHRLVAFDMDSTLINSEVIDELAAAAGVGDKVAAITERAMRGELEFSESFRERLALLKGLDESVLEKIAARLQLNEGAENLIKNLKQLGYKTAILSGGFSYFGRYLQSKLGIDYVYSNELEIIDGKVTGRVKGEIVNGAKKAELLKEIAAKENIRLEQIIAVGDGANDLPMLNTAGLGIAFRAKPLVKASAKQAISTLGLDAILYLIGFRDRDTI